MRRFLAKTAIAGVLFLAVTGVWALEPLGGDWLAPSKNEKAETMIVRFYSYEDRVYGRTVAALDSEGNLIQYPSSGVMGIGVDSYFGLAPDGNNWSGLYIDPAGGGEFNLKIHQSGTNLLVRFEIKGFSFLGHEKIWKPLNEKQQALVKKVPRDDGPPRRP